MAGPKRKYPHTFKCRNQTITRSRHANEIRLYDEGERGDQIARDYKR